MTNENLKTALVTGGATGIGAACSRVLAQAGFRVAIHCNRSVAEAQAIASDLPNGAFVVSADLSTEEGVDRIFEAMKDAGPLEVLVNNAGATVDAPLFNAKLADFDRIVATNMRSTWYLTKRLSRLMMRKRSGCVINISSVVGSTGNPGQSAYGMTKAAIDNFTKTAALELAPFNILVNAIAPGFIETKMTDVLSDDIKNKILTRIPLGRMGTSNEIAQFVKFLATAGTYCTGSIFHVNGGMFCA